MYEKMKGTEPHAYMVSNMPYVGTDVLGRGIRIDAPEPKEFKERLKAWSGKGKLHGVHDRYMVYPRWSNSKQTFVLQPSKIPYGTNAYPRPQKDEGGVFSDFLSRGDLERVVKDLNIHVPDPPHDARYDEMKITDTQNKVYKPFLEKLTRTEDGDLRISKASNV